MRAAVEALEKQAAGRLEGKTMMSAIKKQARDCLKLKVLELRGRKTLVAVEVRQLWIMGQQRGLLMEAKDLKLQDVLPQECPL
ncbi:unnamed protein product [Symbiodinium sp. CCMP2456]|nr:unnamed protein product [Symbiodinium sp. CCMP2456]